MDASRFSADTGVSHGILSASTFINRQELALKMQSILLLGPKLSSKFVIANEAGRWWALAGRWYRRKSGEEKREEEVEVELED